MSCNFSFFRYCDVFQKCREVDPSGPLATLRRLLLSEESIASFKKWITSNWYTVALVVIAVIVLLVSTTICIATSRVMETKKPINTTTSSCNTKIVHSCQPQAMQILSLYSIKY